MMLIVSRLKTSLAEVSPFLIHAFMLISVTIYVLLGAVVMRFLENWEINEVNKKNGYFGPPKGFEAHSAKSQQKRDAGKTVLSGQELSYVAPYLHDCVETAIAKIIDLSRCSEFDPEIDIDLIDGCYRMVKIDPERALELAKSSSLSPSTGSKQKISPKESFVEEGWSFGNSLVFTFTLITTIGYGHIAPVTIEGRIFCMIYGVIGVPLALLTMADVGLFLNKLIKKLVEFEFWIKNFIVGGCKFRKKKAKSVQIEVDASKNEEEEEEEMDEPPPERSIPETINLIVTFFIYLVIGAATLSMYEPEMSFFKAFYFNFVTLTTIGLGDITPRRFNYLGITFVYITIGLALTTIVIEIAADYLKKLHYFGRKLESVAEVEVWFGGKKMKLKNLIKNLGDQFNIPVEQLRNLNLEDFVETALKVEEGEVENLRDQKVPTPLSSHRDSSIKPFSYRDLRRPEEGSIIFADDKSLMTGKTDRSRLDTSRTVITSRTRKSYDTSTSSSTLR
uniref:Potassium channel domain-containing protein n=1 Tax=Acrobeloides nanus TaxID=290746 RepID=A0A914C688_9BILA